MHFFLAYSMRHVHSVSLVHLTLPVIAAALLTPPQPPRSPTTVLYGAEPGVLKTAGDTSALLDPPIAIVDELFELRDRTNEQSLAHIRAENEYADAFYASNTEWRDATEELHTLLTRPSQQRDATANGSLPPLLWHRWSDTGGYEYAKQTGTGPHAQYWRRRVADSDGNGGDAKPVLLFGANAAPALLQSAFQPGVSFMGTVRGVSAFMPSPSGRFAAYTVDTTGEEVYSLMVVEFDAPADGDSGSNAALSCRVVTSVADVDVDIAWGADDQELYYCTMDDTGAGRAVCIASRWVRLPQMASRRRVEPRRSLKARLRASCHLQGPRPSARDQGRRQRRRHPRALEELVQRAPPKGARAEATPREAAAVVVAARPTAAAAVLAAAAAVSCTRRPMRASASRSVEQQRALASSST